MVHDALTDNDLRFFKCLRDVAESVAPCDDAIRPVLMHARRIVAESSFDVNDGFERLIVDKDEVGGVTRAVARVGHDNGDGFPDVAGNIDGDEIIGGGFYAVEREGNGGVGSVAGVNVLAC